VLALLVVKQNAHVNIMAIAVSALLQVFFTQQFTLLRLIDTQSVIFSALPL
jgi:hypothetical protein